MGVGELQKDERMYQIKNNSNKLSTFYKEINLHWDFTSIEFNRSLLKIDKITISLEKSILYVLFKNVKSGKYLTTNDIACQINTMLGVNKNKNNISRYFHQKYYPYYEIDCSKEKTRYRLSSIGVSEVKRLLLG